MTADIEFHCNECRRTTIRLTGHLTNNQRLQLIHGASCPSCGSKDVEVTEGSYDEDDEAD